MGDDRLDASARDLILDPENPVFVSAATIWEIAIKHALGRGGVPFSGGDAVRHCATAGYESLPITLAHAAGVEMLPPLHADPFDRLLVAQSLLEPLRLVTHDAAVAAYSKSVLLF